LGNNGVRVKTRDAGGALAGADFTVKGVLSERGRLRLRGGSLAAELADLAVAHDLEQLGVE
jgi:hypothetical protein